MNQSYERTLNQLSLVKKTLNSEKNSHQNTLEQLENSYNVIEEMKQMLKKQQESSKKLKKQLILKSDQISQMCHSYQEQITGIKDLIQAKDQEIRKFTSMLKVSDYDMIRLRVINEVEATHTEEIEELTREIKKIQFLHSQAIFQNNVLKDKNQSLTQQLQKLNQNAKDIQQQKQNQTTQQLNKLYASIQEQKILKKQVERKLQQQKERYELMIRKYRQELQNVINQTHSGKQNNSLRENNSSLTRLNLKENELVKENENLRKQIYKNQLQTDKLKAKHKLQNQEAKRKIFDLEKQLQFAQQELENAKHEINFKQDLMNKDIGLVRKQNERKLSQLKDNFEEKIMIYEKQIKSLQNRCKMAEKNHTNHDKTTKANAIQQKLEINKLQDNIYELKNQNSQLKLKLKNLQQQMNTQAQQKFTEAQNRTVKSKSVHQAKDKLKIANAQIVSLLKDKIVLNEKLEKLQKQK